MEKKARRMIIRGTPIICLLLLALFSADFYWSYVVTFHQRVQRVSGSSIEDSESSEVQESKPLTIKSRGVAQTLLHEPGSKLNETVEVLEPRSRVVGKTTLQEHESGQVSQSGSVFNETIEVQDSRLDSLRSRIVDETLQEHDSRKVHQSSRESNETVRVEEQKSSQLTNSSRELNETVEERRAEHLSSSNDRVNGTVELQEAGQLIKEVRETIGPESRQPSPINRKANDSRESLFTRLVRGEDRTKLDATGFACDTSIFSVVCVTNKPVTIDMATMTVHIPADQTVELSHTVVRPYARQEDENLLRSVRPVQIFHGNTTTPACQYNHNVPAVIFSSSGFIGNIFHEFNEIIIPLFITTYHFQSRVRFILMDYNPTFLDKFKRVMSRLSSYEVINPADHPSVHCFPGAVAGLKFHDFLAVNSSDIPGGCTIHSFRQLLRQAYSLKIINVSEIKRPRLLLISRRKTRRFLNEDEMVRMMKNLGFEVIVVTELNRTSILNEFGRVVNSCSVLVASHGAALTNELFLPDGAVVVQIEGLGLEWASASYYGNPAEGMGLHYLRYKIEQEESGLVDIYGRNHPAVTDPLSIQAQGYRVGRFVYLDQQDLKVNLVRFRGTLLEALRLTGFSTTQEQ